MTKKRYIPNLFSELLGWTGALALVFTLGSCVSEDTTDCVDPIPTKVSMKVVLSPKPGQDDIDISTVSDVNLYVFDRDERLIEVRPTEIGRIEKFDYSGDPLTITALANVGNGQEKILPANAGDHKNSASLRVKPLDDSPVDGCDMYSPVDDVIWGELEIAAASRSAAEQTLDLSVRRMTSAVRVVIHNLAAYAERNGWNGPFTVTLRSVDKYHQLDFYGKVSVATSEIRYILYTEGMTGQTDVLEIPGQDSGKAYFNIFSTDDGALVEVEIFDGSSPTPVFKVNTDSNQNVIKALNGKTCYIILGFPMGEGANVEIIVDSPGWGYVPPIIGDF